MLTDVSSPHTNPLPSGCKRNMSSPVERSYDIRQNHPWHPEDRKAKVAVESAIGGGMVGFINTRDGTCILTNKWHRPTDIGQSEGAPGNV